MMHLFHYEKLMHPAILLLLPAVAALLAAEWFAKTPGALAISTGEALGRIGARRRTRLRHLPAVLRACGLALLLVALARPLSGLRPRIEHVDVADIMLCVDVSGSMGAMDFSTGGKPRDRLYVTKAAVRDFINSRKVQIHDRFGVDRVGLILYAGYAWTQTPLTLDYGAVEQGLDDAQVEKGEPLKNGTAIGSAIGLAAGKLKDSEAVSKVIILLTDGQNNKGELDPFTAARIAAEYGIRIYTIGAGSDGQVFIPRQTPLGEQIVRMRIPVDVASLTRIAEATGGKFFKTSDSAGIQKAYAEINELETTPIEVKGYVDYEERFAPWAVAGALLIGLSLFSRRMWFDPIP